jgi:hypothetical protein
VRRGLLAFAFAFVLNGGACAGLLGITEVHYYGNDDGGANGPDAESPATYNDISDPTKWEAFDLLSLDLKFDPRFGSGTGPLTGAFDGKFLYVVSPNHAVVVARFDVTRKLSDPDSWTVFDVSRVMYTAFVGAVAYDGRYLYLSPDGEGAIVVRYDTHGDFTSASSWEAFSILGAGLIGDGGWAYFDGVVHAGGSIVFVPNLKDPGFPLETPVAFYTRGDFRDAASWMSVSLQDVGGRDAGRFLGGGGRRLCLPRPQLFPTDRQAREHR